MREPDCSAASITKVPSDRPEMMRLRLGKFAVNGGVPRWNSLTSMHQSIWKRLGFGYLMADLNYVLFTKRFPHPGTDPAVIEAQEAYWIGNCAIAWFSWVGASLLGIALANSIPLSWGLGFAGILALLGIMLKICRVA